MQPARISELLQPYLGPPGGRALTTVELRKISTYIDLLVRWNARMNLTAIRDPEEIVTRHFGESLFAARQLFPIGGSEEGSKRSAPSVYTAADVGSGAGFPGIPIRLWQPNIHLTLIESNHKKATFLREAARTLGLDNVEVITERAEAIVGRSFDLVTLRAVDRMESVLPRAARLLGFEGRLVLFLGSAQVGSVRSSLGLKWEPEIPIPRSDSRLLLIGRNQAST